jgi:quercetin dioxygenase-like cupin family protein
MNVATGKWSEAEGPLQLGSLRLRLEAEGMKTAWFSEGAGDRFPEHEHPFPEARWVLSGFLQVEAAGDVYVLGPGDRLDLPAHTPHHMEVLGLAPVVYVTGAPAETVPKPAA